MQSAWSFTGETGASDFVETLLSRILTLQGALSLSLALSISRVIFSTSILTNLSAIHHYAFSCPLPPNFILFIFSTRFLSLQSLPTLPRGNNRLVSIYHQLTGHKILLRLVSNHTTNPHDPFHYFSRLYNKKRTPRPTHIIAPFQTS